MLTILSARLIHKEQVVFKQQQICRAIIILCRLLFLPVNLSSLKTLVIFQKMEEHLLLRRMEIYILPMVQGCIHSKEWQDGILYKVKKQASEHFILTGII